MTDFFRFPHTPHLAWMGSGSPRDDKIMSPAEASAILAERVVVEEKLDGANLGISVGPDGTLRVQNRGQYLTSPYSGQFARIASALAPHDGALTAALGRNLILFGEWCAARHSLDYSELPDWFLAFDVYDRSEGRFWSTARRDALANQLDLSIVPSIFAGQTTLESLRKLVLHQPSCFRSGSLEGVVVRRENTEWLEFRAKLVHPDFTQAIGTHWSRRKMVWNRLGPTSGPRAKSRRQRSTS